MPRAVEVVGEGRLGDGGLGDDEGVRVDLRQLTGQRRSHGGPAIPPAEDA